MVILSIGVSDGWSDRSLQVRSVGPDPVVVNRRCGGVNHGVDVVILTGRSWAVTVTVNGVYLSGGHSSGEKKNATRTPGLLCLQGERKGDHG